MKAILMILGDRDLAKIYEDGRFEQLVEFTGPVYPNLLQLYEDCFYNVPNSSTFDERFNLAEKHEYFCWTKPALQLAALIIPEEVPTAEDEIRTSIKSVYEMLRKVLVFYEYGCYRIVLSEEEKQDIQKYMENKLLGVRKEIDRLFPDEEKISAQLMEIVDETEQYVRSYEIPGVVERWKQINPHIVFYEYSFNLGKTHQDESLAAARNRYFEEIKKKIEDEYLEYSEDRAFNNEILRTLTLVFKHDFKEYLNPEGAA